MYEPANDDAADVPGKNLGEKNSKSDIQHGNQDVPPPFSFTKTPGPLHIRESGAPELVPHRMSMEPEPSWLDQPEWDFFDRTKEVEDGFSLSGPHKLYVSFHSSVFQWIRYRVSTTSRWRR